MKKQLTKIGNISFMLLVPASIEEFDSAHGRVGAVLDKAVNYDVAHTILGKIRTKAGAKLVELGFKRDVSGKDSNGADVLKPIDTKWIDRGFAELGIDPAQQAAMFQEIADELGYDVSATRGGNKEFNQVDMKDAKGLLDAIKLGKTTFERVKANLEGRNAGLEIELGEDGSFTIEQLAAGLKIERARVEAARQAELNGLL